MYFKFYIFESIISVKIVSILFLKEQSLLQLIFSSSLNILNKILYHNKLLMRFVFYSFKNFLSMLVFLISSIPDTNPFPLLCIQHTFGFLLKDIFVLLRHTFFYKQYQIAQEHQLFEVQSFYFLQINKCHVHYMKKMHRDTF